MNEDTDQVSRWLGPDDWGSLLRNSGIAEGEEVIKLYDRFSYKWAKRATSDIDGNYADTLANTANLTIGGIWLGAEFPNLSDVIRDWWPKLRVGGILAGPSYGSGFYHGRRWAFDTRSDINVVGEYPDASEIFTGNQANPSWFCFKTDENSDEKILILSGSERVQKDAFGDVVISNHRRYADEIGADYKWLDFESTFPHSKSRRWVWGKIWAMMEHLREGTWSQVWWVDADSVFLDQSIRIGDYLHPNWSALYPEFIWKNKVNLSTGVWGARSSHLGALEQSWHDWKGKNEEETLSVCLHNKPKLWQNTQVCDHRIINGVPSKGLWYPNRKNFICHLAGMRNGRRKVIFDSIEAKLKHRLPLLQTSPRENKNSNNSDVSDIALAEKKSKGDNLRYEFTTDWFSQHIPNWEKHLDSLSGKPISALEIGSWEGRSAVWLLENILNHPKSTLACIDLFAKTDAEKRFDNNLAATTQSAKATKHKGESWAFLREFNPESYDLIYVDGSHHGRNVLEDAVLSFRLLKKGAIMIFDDYPWRRDQNYDSYPKEAIDGFLGCYRGCVEVLEIGWQVIIRKKNKKATETEKQFQRR